MDEQVSAARGLDDVLGAQRIPADPLRGLEPRVPPTCLWLAMQGAHLPSPGQQGGRRLTADSTRRTQHQRDSFLVIRDGTCSP